MNFSSMWLLAVHVLPSVCIAVDYRTGCAFGKKKKSFNNAECRDKLKTYMDDDASLRITLHEDNIELWADILKLSNEYGYEFSTSWKTITAAKRIATRIAKDSRYGAELGAGVGGMVGFGYCFVWNLLDNPACGPSASCHAWAAARDGAVCASGGLITGGIGGGIVGTLTGTTGGVISAYEEYDAIRVHFDPPGPDSA